MIDLRAIMQTGPARANELFAKITDTSDTVIKTRERIFGELKAELELQCSLEEEHLFPVLVRNSETKHLVTDAMRDNQELREKLAELDSLPKSDTVFPTRIAELRKAFRQHAWDEKKELLPAVQRALSESQTQAVAGQIKADLDAAEGAQAEAKKRRAKAQHEREQAERQRNVEAEPVRQAKATRAALQVEQGVRRTAEQVANGAGSVGTAVHAATEAYNNTAQLTASHLQAVADRPNVTLGGMIKLQSTWMELLGKTATTSTRISQDLLWQLAERQKQVATKAMQTSQELLRQVAEGQRQLAASAMQGWMESNVRIMRLSLRAAKAPFKGNTESQSGNLNNDRS